MKKFRVAAKRKKEPSLAKRLAANKKKFINPAFAVIPLLLAVILFSLSPLFLNSKVTAAPVPAVSVNLPTEGFIGENFSFTLNFANSGTNTGYGPFVDLIFPYKGNDGVYPFDPGNENDGVNFLSATFLGTPLTTTVLDFTIANSGCVNHPYAVDNTGVPVVVCGTIGEKLVVLQLPFGSFVTGQPNVDLTVNANINSWADEGVALTIQTRGGFQYGATAVNDFTTDPSILNSFSNNNIIPRIMTLTKIYNGPEGETATGPNFPRQFTARANIANGQTITGFTLRDNLPNNIAYNSFASATPGGSSVTDSPTVGVATNAPTNNLDVTWTSVTGGAGSNDASMSFNFHAPYLDANGSNVIPDSGGCVNSVNDISASGTWDPVDPRDALTVVSSDATANDYTLQLCSHTVRKTVANASDVSPTGNTPGDSMQYTISFDISDFFAYDDFNLFDLISDGQRFKSAFNPTLSLNMHGSSTSGNIDIANQQTVDHFTGGAPAVPTIDGTQEVNFAMSNELITRGFSTAGRVIGGCVPLVGGSIDCTGSSATSGTIVYQTLIQQAFTDDYLPQNPNVDQGDVLNNSIDMEGDILNNSTLADSGKSFSEDSGASFSIINGILAAKTIYAINGVIGSYSTPKVGPGDNITYKITFNLPVSDVENLVITDYLPLPVFDATDITSFSAVVSAAVPAVGSSKFGPDDTFFAFSGITPAFSTDGPSNTLIWDYGSYQTTSESARVIDILFTVPASDQPFADGLFLTNQAQSSQGTTNNNVTTATQIVQVELTLPELHITKGAVSSDNTGAVFTPSTVGPVVFSTPPGSCPRFAPTINSNNLGTTPIDSDISDVDAGDLVTFAIVIENQGQGTNGAFDIRIKDAIPAGYVVPGGGLNVCAHNGAGTALAFSAVDGGDTNPLIEDGIELTDEPTAGALDAYHATNGENIAIITYNLQVAATVEPASEHENTATLLNYAASNGGPDFTSVDPTDTALTTILNIANSKSILTTNITTTAGNNVVIGEIVDYEVELTIPEGQTLDATLLDSLDSGLAIHSLTSLTPSAGLSTSHAGGFPGVFADATIGVNGTSVSFPFDDIINSNTDNSTAETITIVYRVVVLNQSGIVRGSNLNNSANLTWSSPQQSVIANATNVTVIEPTLQVVKTASPTTADTGDSVAFTVVVSHTGPSNSTAYDIQLSDILPSGLSYAGGLSHTAGVAPNTLSESGGTITATWDSLTTAQSSTFTFNTTVGSVTLGSTITNTANIQWTSILGDFSAAQSVYNANSNERRGSGGGANNYAALDNEVVTVFGASPTKTIASTSEAHTTIVSSVHRVVPGEIVRYRLQIRVAEATATNLQLQDSLATGMQFLNDNTARVAFVSNTGGITSSTLIPASIGCDGGANPDLVFTGNETTVATIVPECPLPDTSVSSSTSSNTDAYTSGTDPYFKMGNLTNSDTDSDQEFIIVEFNAITLNAVANQSAVTINNTFNTLVNGTNIGSSSSGTPSRVTVAEPTVSLAKNVTTTPVDAGDSIVFDLVVTNTSAGSNSAAAFNINVLDNVATGNLTLTSVVVSTPNSYTDDTSGNLVDVKLDRLNPSQSATITVTATVNSGVGPGQQLLNTANLTFTSLPDLGTSPNATGSVAGTAGTSTGERTGQDGTGLLNAYVASANATVTLGSSGLEKLAPNPTDYAIGELVTYYLRVTFPEGVINDVNVTDVLPVGLDYESYQIITSSTPYVLTNNFSGSVPVPTVTGGSGSGADVTFNFNSVTVTNDNDSGNNSFVIQVDARVLNIAANQRGVNLNNSATMNYDNPNNPVLDVTVNAPLSRTVTIKEPILTIAKTATSIPSPVQAGSIVSYQIVVQHHANSNSDAHQVVITDPLSTGLTNISNVNVSVSGSIPVPSVSTSGGNITVPATGSISIPDDGSSVTITFDAEVNAGANTTITNSADVDWASNSSTNANTRGSANGPYDLSETNATGLNDYTVSDDDSSVATDSPSISKILLNTSSSYTSEASSPVQLAPGENATIYLKVNIPEGLTADLDVTDDLAPNVEYVSHQIITSAAGSNGQLTDDFNGSVSAPVCTNCIAGTDGANLVFEFTNVNVNVDGDGTNNFFIIEIIVKTLNTVVNDGILPGQTTFSNTSSIQANSGTINNSGTLDFIIVEPNLTISKEFDTGDDPDAATPNSVVTVDITIANNGTTAAHDVVWEDDLDAVNSGTMTYQSGTLAVICSAGVVDSFNLDDSAAPVLSGDLAALPAGESCDITFNLVLNSNIDVNVNPTLTNNTQTEFSSHPGNQSGEKGYGPVTDGGVLTVLVPDMQVTKDDGQANAIPNQVLTYNITVDNVGTASAPSVVVNETVPANTTFLPAVSSVGWVCTPDNNAGSNCSFDVATAIGGVFSPSEPVYNLTFAVQIDNPLAPLVTEIENTVNVVMSNSNGIDPTPLNNTDTDTDTIVDAIDLLVSKDDGVDTIAYNQDLTYTISYQNQGTLGATGVAITETVPADTIFNQAASPVGWSCLPDNNAGSICTYNVGNLNAGQAGTIDFVVTVNDYLPLIIQIENTVEIEDDGANGPEITLDNNTDDLVTPVAYSNVFDPPSSEKTVNADGVPVLTWRMVWINDGNATALMVRIIDPIPAGTTYVNGSFTCDARGASLTSSCSYDSMNNRVIWEGDIAPDIGGTNEDDSLNEVVLTLQTTVAEGIDQVDNQAQAYWDDNGNGDIDDDITAGQVAALSNDPVTSPDDDPTRWEAAELTNTGKSLNLSIIFGLLMLSVLAIIRYQDVASGSLMLSVSLPILNRTQTTDSNTKFRLSYKISGAKTRKTRHLAKGKIKFKRT